jgi:hypothetical protein
LKPDHAVPAKVMLKDGRVLSVTASVDPARPKVVLINKSVQLSAQSAASNVQLADPGELPLDATLVFSIRAQTPFTRDETIDVATGDEGLLVSLSLANGGLALENSRVAVATFNPLKSFGGSSYGPLKVRVESKGVAGDWQPLATLVRLPALKSLECPPTSELACKLSGANLYLIDSVSADAGFGKPVVVPDGFLGSAIPVPHPNGGALFLKLRDDPDIVNSTSLTAQQLPATPTDTERSGARQSALRPEAPSGTATTPPATPAPPLTSVAPSAGGPLPASPSSSASGGPAVAPPPAVAPGEPAAAVAPSAAGTRE